MSLRVKFLFLVGMLALAVASSIGAAGWSFTMLHRQLARPLASVAVTLDTLSHIKRHAERQAAILAGAQPGDPDKAFQRFSADDPRGVRGAVNEHTPPAATREQIAAFDEDSRNIQDLLASLEQGDLYRARVGSFTWKSLKDKLRRADALAALWFSPSVDPPIPSAGSTTPGSPASARADAISMLFQVHELIEATEAQVHNETKTAVVYGDSIERQLVWWLASVFLVGALTSALAVVLLGRWVSRPVSLLRDAAARIAQGDFSHRVPVQGADELGLLTAEVNHMAAMVHQLQEDRIESERLAAVGGMLRRLVHSLRNPLSGIRGLAEVTRLDLRPGSENRTNLDHIVSTVDTFERWLNDLLRSATPATLAASEHDVRPWLESVVQAHRPMAQTRGATLELDVAHAPQSARFDATHLEHAVAALVSNAVEAAPANSTVRVTCDAAQGENWEIRVHDQGPGVPDEVRARIFEPYFTTKPKGTGIGLAVAQQVAVAHGGRIALEQPDSGNEEVGATFVLRIPLSGCCAQPVPG
jgi:signal transduction histidine kinase